MSDKTMWDHAVEFYTEQGVKVPPKGSREAVDAYGAWVTWAFSNLDGRSKKAERAARKLLDKKVDELRKNAEFWDYLNTILCRGRQK